MRDPEYTRQLIIDNASILFNTKGYKATSISDITSRAGITKGAIYKHFKDKSQLEKECLTVMTQSVFNKLSQNIRAAEDVKTKLWSILDYFAKYKSKPPIIGGCPLMNAAIEADDSDPVLKKVVCNIMTGLLKGIEKVIQNGINRNQFQKDVNVSEYATMMYSAIEGGIMMMQVTDNEQYLSAVINFLKQDIENKTL